MSREQRETVDAILRRSAFPAGSDVNEQRRLLREAVSAQPLPADVTVTAGALGGVPTAEITVDGIEPRYVVLYFHGGVYVIGDAFLAADAALGLISGILAALAGLPPLIIQSRSHELLLDDAVRLPQQAAAADVEVTLDITPGVPHVFQAYHAILDEAVGALDRAGQLLLTHLAGAERVAGERKAERQLVR